MVGRVPALEPGRKDTMHWFLAHKEGLRQVAERLVERRGFGIVGGELYQNVMDTDATECVIELRPIPNRAAAFLSVVDDHPEGFSDLTHAYTVFAPSLKKSDPTKAGRFNLGEKMVLAFCHEARISTTKGEVTFNEDGRKERPRRKREYGTEFKAEIACTRAQIQEFLDYMQRIIPREGLTLTVNGERIEPRTPIHTFETKLQTEIEGDNGALRKTVRNVEVRLYEPRGGEVASLYELGIPVVETGDRWHYDVRQKVPLNMDRDNVTPAYLRDLRTAVFNEMHDRIEEEDTESAWVSEAADSSDVIPEAAETYRVKRYGEKSVAFDPSNPEANAVAVSSGYTLIPARGLTRGQRDNLYKAGTLFSSSKMFPKAGKGAYSDDPNAEPVEVVKEENLTSSMLVMRMYAQGVARRILGREVTVRFVLCKSFVGKRWAACYGPGHLDFNVWVLGKKWFDQGATIAVDDLLIHEFAHEYESNHLSESYYNALSRLGAKLKAAVMTEPKWFRQFAPDAQREPTKEEADAYA